jgi:hypothetical protein
VRPYLIKGPSIAFFPFSTGSFASESLGMSPFRSQNRKHFRCSRKWEIGTVPIVVHEDARNTLYDKVIELVRCYHTFPPVRPCSS